jgi:Pyruvate/2-oxoacid:ferredoxin oxidoreductase delta subunit
VDYQRLAEIGAIMGSGGMVVMNERSCMADVARFFMQFTQHESCGKCVPCREGTRRMLAMLDDICEGRESNLESLKLLEELALVVKESSLCGLGQTAPNPILSTLKHFRPEYESHIREHYSPSGVCKELFEYEIDHELCVGCGLCAKACPQGAISGVKKQAFTINQSKCIKCRICYQTCSVKAVKAVKAASKE